LVCPLDAVRPLIPRPPRSEAGLPAGSRLMEGARSMTRGPNAPHCPDGSEDVAPNIKPPRGRRRLARTHVYLEDIGFGSQSAPIGTPRYIDSKRPIKR
jgi:hypothetical protein